MSSTSFFSPEYDCNFFHFENGQKGLFFSDTLNIILIGEIKDFKLEATVHKTMLFPFNAFSIGYKYGDWDLKDMIYFPNDIITYSGFLKWLNNPNTTERQIKAYFKIKTDLNTYING